MMTMYPSMTQRFGPAGFWRSRGMGQSGNCISVTMADGSTSTDCPTAGVTTDSSGNIYWVDSTTNHVMQLNTAGQVTDTATGKVATQAGTAGGGLPALGLPGGNAPAGNKPGPGLGLCYQIIGTGPLSGIVCSTWFLIALAVLGGVIVLRVVSR